MIGYGKPGHIKANCRNTWLRERSRRINASRRAYGQGDAHQSYQRRPRHISARQRMTERSEGDRCRDTNYKNTGSFNTEVVKEIRNSQVEINVRGNGKVEWILDNGCTDHVRNIF